MGQLFPADASIVNAVQRLIEAAEHSCITIDGITVPRERVAAIMNECNVQFDSGRPDNAFRPPGPEGGVVGTLFGVRVTQAPDVETRAGLMAQMQTLLKKLETAK
jgi:hypothetical protein